MQERTSFEGRMREWEPEELVASWTLVERDQRELVAYKQGAGRLGTSRWRGSLSPAEVREVPTRRPAACRIRTPLRHFEQPVGCVPTRRYEQLRRPAPA